MYYISSYIDLLDEEQLSWGDGVTFVVPTGNFGNILAGWYAKQMGIPVKRLVCASNSNSVLTDFFRKGEYNANRAFLKTMSPSMDILVSGNLERLLFEMSGRNDVLTAERMGALKEKGVYTVSDAEKEAMDAIFSAYRASEDDTLETIVAFFDEYDYPLDPHTAVGMYAAGEYREESGGEESIVVLSTASPYKFPQDVLFAITADEQKDCFRACKQLLAETAMEIPQGILELKTKPKRHTAVLTVDQLKDAVLQR